MDDAVCGWSPQAGEFCISTAGHGGVGHMVTSLEVDDTVYDGEGRIHWIVKSIGPTGIVRLASGQTGIRRISRLEKLRLHSKGTGRGL